MITIKPFLPHATSPVISTSSGCNVLSRNADVGHEATVARTRKVVSAPRPTALAAHIEPRICNIPTVLIGHPRTGCSNMRQVLGSPPTQMREPKQILKPAAIVMPGDLDGTSDLVTVTEEDFSVACECGGTPAPAGADPSPIAASPTSTPPTLGTGDTSGSLGRWLSSSWWILAGATCAMVLAIEG